MPDQRPQDDLSSEELQDSSGITGELITDESGYQRARFANPEAINKLYAKLIADTLRDYKRIDKRRDANLDAHEGLPERGEMIMLKVALRDTNQQLAWILSTLFKKKPFITIRPLEVGHTKILSMNEAGQMEEKEVSTIEEAEALQALLDFYLTEKIHIKKVIRPWLTEMLQDGNRPPLLKVVHDDLPTPKMQRLNLNAVEGDTSGKLRRINTAPLLSDIKNKPRTRIEAVPADRFYLPPPYADIQTAPLAFQDFECDTATLKSNLATGPNGEPPKWDLAGLPMDDDVLDRLINGYGDGADKRKVTDAREASDPTRTHRLFETWMYLPFAATDAASGTPVFEWHSFCGIFHEAGQMFLTVYDNPAFTKLRPFIPGYIQQKPHSFAGWSPTENVAPYQRLMSTLFHLQIQNMVQQNIKVYLARDTSVTYKFLKNPKNKLRPGLIIPFEKKDDYDSHQLGSPIQSMASEISFLNLEAEKITVVTQFDRGQIPNRTPNQTVETIEELAKMQPAMYLDCIREAIGEAAKLFLQTLIQYNHEGLTIPFRDPDTAQIIARVINFPIELITEQFAFEVTATADDMTPEALFNQMMLAKEKVVQVFNDRAMTIIASSMKPSPGPPGAPPVMPPAPVMTIGMNMILKERKAASAALKHMKLDPDDYLLTELEIQSLPVELMSLAGLSKEAGNQPPEGALPNEPPQPPQLPPSGPGPALSTSGSQPQPVQPMGVQPNVVPAGGPPPAGIAA
jgi:hypothetical protein